MMPKEKQDHNHQKHSETLMPFALKKSWRFDDPQLPLPLTLLGRIL